MQLESAGNDTGQPVGAVVNFWCDTAECAGHTAGGRYLVAETGQCVWEFDPATLLLAAVLKGH